MDDQGVETRPALGRIDSRHRLAIGGIAGKPVDRFRAEPHDAAGIQNPGRLLRRIGTV